MCGRGVEVDHSNIYRWIQKFTPQLEASFRKGKKRSVSKSWWMDESVLQLSCIKDEGRPRLSKYSNFKSILISRFMDSSRLKLFK